MILPAYIYSEHQNCHSQTFRLDYPSHWDCSGPSSGSDSTDLSSTSRVLLHPLRDVEGVDNDSLSTFPSPNIYGMIIHITTCMDLVPFLFSLSVSVRCLCVMLIARDPYHSFMTLDVTSKIGGPPFGAPSSCPDKHAATKSKDRRLCRDSLSCSQLPGAANKIYKSVRPLVLFFFQC